jgi:hypothetical protein
MRCNYETSDSNRGAGYTFGSGVVYKFFGANGMSHILCSH